MRILVRRVADALLLFWLVVTVTFVLVRAAPGDAADLLVPPTASAADVARIRSEFGLDAPVAEQYVRWVGQVFRGDLGESFSAHQPVATVLAAALPVSIWLGSASLALTFLIGVSVAMWQVRRHHRASDRVATALTVAAYASPSYWVALAVVAVFTYGAAKAGLPEWARLPAFGISDPARLVTGWRSVPDILRHSILPVFVLTVVGAAGVARYGRSRLLDLARADWVRTALAKGVGRRATLQRHMLANAMPMLIVLLGLSLPGIVAGSVFVESVFAWPGLGRAMLTAISARDYPVVMGATMLYSGVVILANLLADAMLPLVDPRQRA